MAHHENVQWIIPPGLFVTVKHFERHCRLALEERMPVLVYGDTGVGKSLFLKIFEQMYKDKFGEDRIVKKQNCAHFSGADPRVAQVELFGAVKGSATGITANKNGLLFAADKGLLILDEIGELPLEIQAMLLTYIETGEYRKLGDLKEDSADVFIIASTNSPDKLRRDFYQRFFPFDIPALYERRNDILYYFALRYPDLITKLNSQEILTLISYHWPGNLRELERIGLVLKRHKEPIYEGSRYASRKALFFGKSSNEYLYMDTFVSMLERENDEDIVDDKFNKLQVNREYIDFNTIEKVMNHYHVSVKYMTDKIPFSNLKIEDIKYNNIRGIKWIMEFDMFEEAFAGYKIFCLLYLQNYFQKSNAMKLREYTIYIPDFPTRDLRVIRNLTRGLDLQMLRAVSNDVQIDSRIKQVPFDDFKRIEFFEELLKSNPDNLFLKLLLQKEDRNESNIQNDHNYVQLKRDELLRTYYRKVLEMVGGVEKRAARQIGMPYSSFRDDLVKLGLKKYSN